MNNFCTALKYICGLAFLIHFSILSLEHWQPVFVTDTTNTHLRDREFPVIIKICIKPGLDLVELSKVGYDGIYDYFDGISKYSNYDGKHNVSIGWAGHSKNGSKIGKVEGKTLNNVNVVIPYLFHTRVPVAQWKNS